MMLFFHQLAPGFPAKRAVTLLTIEFRSCQRRQFIAR
jgi:hypothetical protein